ncbi:hypothetical protein AK812_SmicGene23859 [Symbiodinium microadriaticum]|uniref:Uncharacterized protein n=1 Tax=Symbiodinium microadriaticum TaxID=2951 RepID=A0A1Q9DG65_SYMMI|nr:hypothetical protein AK812_SmicGene23859 [Symbiodinium microadriaticum]
MRSCSDLVIVYDMCNQIKRRSVGLLAAVRDYCAFDLEYNEGVVSSLEGSLEQGLWIMRRTGCKFRFRQEGIKAGYGVSKKDQLESIACDHDEATGLLTEYQFKESRADSSHGPISAAHDICGAFRKRLFGWSCNQRCGGRHGFCCEKQF